MKISQDFVAFSEYMNFKTTVFSKFSADFIFIQLMYYWEWIWMIIILSELRIAQLGS